MTWETLKEWLRIGKEIGFRLLREDCRHCNGKGICYSGKTDAYRISCASCQIAVLGEIRTETVKCDVCDGRGIFVYALPSGGKSGNLTIDVLPKGDDEWSSLRLRSTKSLEPVRVEGSLPAPRHRPADDSE
jgi:hypothetical protein